MHPPGPEADRALEDRGEKGAPVNRRIDPGDNASTPICPEAAEAIGSGFAMFPLIS